MQTALHLAPLKVASGTHEFPMLKADGPVGKAVKQLIKNSKTEEAA